MLYLYIKQDALEFKKVKKEHTQKKSFDYRFEISTKNYDRNNQHPNAQILYKKSTRLIIYWEINCTNIPLTVLRAAGPQQVKVM